jgi:hypothetical protein
MRQPNVKFRHDVWRFLRPGHERESNPQTSGLVFRSLCRAVMSRCWTELSSWTFIETSITAHCPCVGMVWAGWRRLTTLSVYRNQVVNIHFCDDATMQALARSWTHGDVHIYRTGGANQCLFCFFILGLGRRDRIFKTNSNGGTLELLNSGISMRGWKLEEGESFDCATWLHKTKTSERGLRTEVARYLSAKRSLMSTKGSFLLELICRLGLNDLPGVS